MMKLSVSVYFSLKIKYIFFPVVVLFQPFFPFPYRTCTVAKVCNDSCSDSCQCSNFFCFVFPFALISFFRKKVNHQSFSSNCITGSYQGCVWRNMIDEQRRKRTLSFFSGHPHMDSLFYDRTIEVVQINRPAVHSSITKSYKEDTPRKTTQKDCRTWHTTILDSCCLCNTWAHIFRWKVSCPLPQPFPLSASALLSPILVSHLPLSLSSEARQMDL